LRRPTLSTDGMGDGEVTCNGTASWRRGRHAGRSRFHSTSVGRAAIYRLMLHRLRPNLPGGFPPNDNTPRGEPAAWRGLGRPLLALVLPPIVILVGLRAARVLL
jgi:hypothetical protein